jgi:cytidine deaminase
MKKLSSAQLNKMAAMALKARDNAYAPYSDHPVGAAIMTAGGKIFAGANCEIAHYKGICGEAAAITAMTSAGERVITAVVVVGPGERNLVTPCGDCRQRIREFAALDVPVYSLWKNGRLGRTMTLAEILPYSFGPENVGEVGHGPKAKKNGDNKNKKKKKKNGKQGGRGA